MLRDTDRPSNLSWDVDLVQGVWPDQGNKLYPKPECGLYCVTHCSAKPSLGFRENSHTYLGRPNVSNSVTGVSVTPCSSLSSLKGSLSLTGTWQKSQPISTSGVSAVLLLTRKTFFLFFFFTLKAAFPSLAIWHFRELPSVCSGRLRPRLGCFPHPHMQTHLEQILPFLPPWGSTERQLSCLWRTPCSPALTEAASGCLVLIVSGPETPYALPTFWV